MTLTEQGTPAVLVDATFDALGHCTGCQLSRGDIDRVYALIAAGKATSICVYPRCGHTLIYRSLGLWTANL